jgi:diguanylate cyclase (GGDEF)-like protein
MSLDISTLYLVATFVAAMLGASLLFLWRQEKIPALGWWGAAYIVGAASIGVSTVAGSRLGGAMLAVDVAGFAACGMVLNAARVFHGRKPVWIRMFIGAAIWAVTVLCSDVASTYLRTFVGAAIVAIYAALTASELWSERRQSMQSRWPAVAVPMLHGAVMMLPVVLGGLLYPQDGSANFFMAIFAIELVLYAIGTVFIILMMVNDRTLRAHKDAANLDPLTGLFNRRGFGEATARMISREAKAGRSISVMIFDIDHFKSINDRFGHAAGDEVLKTFSGIVGSNLRITDLIGRIGGEEFAAMLPCSMTDALLAAERVREAFRSCGIEVDNVPVDTTVSIGVASGLANTDLEVLLASADAALYCAKRSGRNRVEMATEEPISLSPDDAATAKPTAPRAPTIVRRTPEMTKVDA